MLWKYFHNNCKKYQKVMKIYWKWKNKDLWYLYIRKNIEETLYLSSIPGFVDDINNIRKNENWDKAKEFNPDEEW